MTIKGPDADHVSHLPHEHLPLGEGAAPPPRSRIHPNRELGWFRRSAPILRAHSGLIATTVTLLILLSAVSVGIIWTIGQVLDVAVFSPPNPKPLTAWLLAWAGLEPTAPGAPYPLAPFIIVLAGLAAIQFALGYLSGVAGSRSNQAIEYNLRALMHEHLTRLPFSFYDAAQTGQLISRANADIRAVQMFLAFAPRLLSAGLSFSLALGLMIQESLLLASASLLTLPGVYFLGLALRTRLFPISWVVQARQADIASIVEESVAGVRIVKTFRAEGNQIDRLAAAAERLRWAIVRQADIRARYAPWLAALPRVSRALLLGIGGWLVLQGQTTIGALVAFNFYVIRLQAPFRLIGFLMVMTQRAAASAYRIFEVLDAQPEPFDDPRAIPLRSTRGEIEFRSVCFGYPDLPPVLRDLNLHIKAGETVAIVGRTGAGKSSLARLLPRFYDVGTGEVRIDGRDIREYQLESLRAQMGLVLDDPFLFSDTVHNNIAYGLPTASRDDVRAAARTAGAHDFISNLPKGYDTLIGERGYTLSGGQRQRLAIARTLLLDPTILILDDATSSIDVQLENRIHASLRKLMQGRTTLIIAHRLSTVRLAERVVLLEDGVIAADGPHERLWIECPAYRATLERWEESDEARGSAVHVQNTDRLARPRATAEPAAVRLGLRDLEEETLG